jgi:hypothetical protein
MKLERLREVESSDAVWAELRRLCASQPPASADMAMQTRVRARMGRERARLGWMRPAFIGLAILLFAATASALWEAAKRRPPAPPPVSSVALPPRTPSATPAVVDPIAPVAERVEETKTRRPSHAHREARNDDRVNETAPAAEPTTDAPISTPSVDANPSRPSPRAAAAPTPDVEESVLVQSAMHALRVDHRAKRAQALLDRYLERYPRGALVEDALALEIEVAVAEHDSTATRRWASRYAIDFPAGRFRSFADEAALALSPKGTDSSHP